MLCSDKAWGEVEWLDSRSQVPLRPNCTIVSFSSLFYLLTDRYKPLPSQHRIYLVENIQKPLCEMLVDSIEQRRADLSGGFTPTNWSSYCTLVESLQCTISLLEDSLSDLSFLGEVEPTASSDVEKFMLSSKSTLCRTYDGVLINLRDVLQAMLSDATTTVERTFKHLTRGYSSWLRDFDRGGFEADVSSHFGGALGWVSGFLDIARLKVGLKTFDALSRAVSRTLERLLMGILSGLKEHVTLKVSHQICRDFSAVVAVITGAGGSSNPDTRFIKLGEVIKVLGLSDSQVRSLLTCLDAVDEDQTADLNFEAMLATHGIYQANLSEVKLVLKSRMRA